MPLSAIPQPQNESQGTTSVEAPRQLPLPAYKEDDPDPETEEEDDGTGTRIRLPSKPDGAATPEPGVGAPSENIPPRRTLTPLGDLPPRGPKFVPPPVDPFTGGPIVPPPPVVPPGIVEDDYLPIVPFFITPICGNLILTAGKQCEDGNVINGDGCSSACKKEYCGNGYIEIGEQCDNGAGRYTVQGPDCDQYCQFIICGDNYVTGDEQCDDGNRENCDGCSRDCQVERVASTCESTACGDCDDDAKHKR